MTIAAPVIPPTVTPLPTPPSTTDPINFDLRADTFLGGLPTNQTQMNDLGANVYSNAVKTFDSATDSVNAANAAVPAATAATTAYTNMQKLYLGAKASAPTVDNQGDTLQVGVWYTNTTLGYWYWWDGSVWKLGMSDLSSVDWNTQVTNKPTTLTGYGITDKTQARNDLGLKSAAVADIIGVVSQSGGTPTGAIIQRGSNANGDFVRFADGTQICTLQRNVATATYGSTPVTVPHWTFPAAFSYTPVINIRNVAGYSPYTHIDTQGTQPTDSGSIYVTAYSGTMTVDLSLSFFAIGRWF